MPQKQKTKLEERHLKALELFSTGHSHREVAQSLGVSEDWVYDMCTGNIGKVGYLATVFKDAYEKIQDQRELRTRDLANENRELCMIQIRNVLSDYDKRKGKLDKEDKKMISMLTNAMAKVTPTVSIGSVTYNYTHGLTIEEMQHEYGRLRAAADGPTDSRGVSEALQAGSGEMYNTAEPRGSVEEVEEDS